MRRPLSILPLLAVLGVLQVARASAQSETDDFYRRWIEYRDGAVSLAFERTPVRFALFALRAATGLQIVVPPASESRRINLRLERRPLEAAVRSLIASIGDKNFALIYDEQGQPRRAVVLSAAAEPAERSAAASEPAVSPLGAEDREKLQNELERWSDLKPEDRSRLEERLKNLPQSGERDRLVQLYGRQILAANR